MVEIQQLLGRNRLLTLTGPGGCGKTRLALETAAGMAEKELFSDGVWLVELASLGEPALVPQAVAAVLGVRQTSDRDLQDVLVTYLKPRQVLLLLDNCEHLIDTCAYLVEHLLQWCPHLRVLSTSREALHIAGEVVWPVPALWLPEESDVTVAQLAEVSAVQLFVERATAVAPSFSLNAENARAVACICRRLDGMPLALELAAARTQAMPVTQIAIHLDDALRFLTVGSRTAAPRHQTLHALIAWSYSLLTKPEQTLLRQLSIFAGEFSLDAVEAVVGRQRAGSDNPTGELNEGLDSDYRLTNADVAEALFHLVGKSLVQIREVEGEARYRLLETIRQFGQTVLSDEESRLLEMAHTQHYQQLTTTIAPLLYLPDRDYWLAKLERDHDNIRSALQRELGHGRFDNALCLCGALWWFWWQRGYWSEGRSWLTHALTGVANRLALRESTGHVQALLGVGVLAWAQTDFVAARHYLEECVQYRQRLDTVTQGYALLFLSATYLYLGVDALPTARTQAEASVALMQSAEHEAGTYLALSNAGIVALFQGDIEQSVAWLEEASAGLRRLGDYRALALPLRNLGYIAYQQGDFERAAALQRESVLSLRGQGDKWFVSRSLELLAITTVRQRAYERAATLFGASEALREAIGAAVLPFYQEAYERGVAATREALSEERFVKAWTAGRQMTAGDWETVISYALKDEPSVLSFEETLPYLRLVGFGAAEVYRAGVLLTASEWSYAKPRELLFYLLTHGPKSREEIGLTLWPDAAPEQLRRSFHTALHRLRRALGRTEWIVLEHHRYAFNRELDYWFDLEAFAGGVEEAYRLEASNRTQAIQVLNRAVSLYRGDLLTDILSDWTVPVREQWAQRYHAALLALGEWLSADSRFSEAAAVYRRAIAHDNLQEAAHRGLMQCYIRLGEVGQAIRHYRRLVKLLIDELGVDPAPETILVVEPYEI